MDGVIDASGVVAATYRYRSYGESLASRGTLSSNPYRFGGSYGAYTDTSTGLLKTGQRFYDPTLGRWTQPDPLLNLQDPQQWNRYGYVAGNPVNFIDPSGTSCAGALIGFVGSAGGAIYAGLSGNWPAAVSGSISVLGNSVSLVLDCPPPAETLLDPLNPVLPPQYP